jgi:hypothetical protein
MALTNVRKLLILRSTKYQIWPFRAPKYPFQQPASSRSLSEK